MTPTPQRLRRTGRYGRVGIAIASLAATGFGFGVLGAGTAFAQTTHRTHVGSATASVSKAKVTSHERRESAKVRASENASNDPTSTDPHEPTDPSSNDPSANDEGSTDTPSTDSNDTADQPSTDQAAINQSH
jgi:hypothetical protein